LSIKAVVFDAYGTLYDVQSVASVTEETFPGYGEIITQVWRIKQLEYTWLRSLMRRYEDFSVVTRESLAYTLRILGLQYDEQTFARYGHDTRVSMNCWRFAPAIFDACRRITPSARGELELPNAVRYAVRVMKERIRAIPIEAGVLDLSRREDIAAVEQRLSGIDATP